MIHDVVDGIIRTIRMPPISLVNWQPPRRAIYLRRDLLLNLLTQERLNAKRPAKFLCFGYVPGLSDKLSKPTIADLEGSKTKRGNGHIACRTLLVCNEDGAIGLVVRDDAHHECATLQPLDSRNLLCLTILSTTVRIRRELHLGHALRARSTAVRATTQGSATATSRGWSIVAASFRAARSGLVSGRRASNRRGTALRSDAPQTRTCEPRQEHTSPEQHPASFTALRSAGIAGTTTTGPCILV
mmetsp:Transcript_47932/g.111833  ORF Transcript_47932/g.111833 Transcript_47932/m.111833 type:complete len:243 (-) Transcript_47932:8-736(-)